ncbi:MAG: ATP-binding cassette, subfamily bacterial [Gaiellales bacterium]|jgi:ABC-type multidrug transport system fused ATPase/permease subunit|nr:ATP-binding cassette, subfamily bacterial [Gaiellales bacterium]
MAVTAPVSTVDPPDLSFGPTARHLTREWWVERRLVGIGLLCALATTAFGIAIPVLVQRVIDNSIVARDHSELALYLALIVVCACLRFATNSTRRAITSRIGIVIENRLRATLYDAYLTYPRAFYDRHATGQVLSRATNDLYPIRYFIGWGVVQVCSSIMMIIGVTIVLLGVNARLALYAGLTMPLIALLTWRFARLVTPLSRVVQQRKADLTEAADESIVGMEMVQAFGREAEVRERFSERAEGVRQSSLREAGVEARYLPGLTFLPSMAIASVLFFGGRDVIDGNLTIGQFVLFNSLLLQLVWPLEALGWILNLAQRAIASASRAFAWLDAVQPLPEAEHPAHLPDGGLDVRYEDVCFAYAGGSPVLCDLDLEIAAGTIVAVCGETGSGKSTMLNLLSRFYDPDSGSVRVGGIEVSALRKADLRTGVALVTQRPVLFSLPLRENLCAARPEATEEEMIAACEVAGVAAFIDDLPDGYDTLIGERGVNLSGGQRQRVALARALISSARVLVLDDPLSAVDTENEEQIVRRLRPALAGRTVLLASQRLSTVALADRAVVLEDGVIVEDGPPRALLGAGGTFERLFGDEVRVA